MGVLSLGHEDCLSVCLSDGMENKQAETARVGEDMEKVSLFL